MADAALRALGVTVGFSDTIKRETKIKSIVKLKS